MERQAEGIECRRDVGCHGQSHEDGEEFTKVPRGAEHGLDESANVSIGVADLPRRDRRRGNGDSGAETLDGDLEEGCEALKWVKMVLHLRLED